MRADQLTDTARTALLQTLQDELTGAAFHPLDDNLLITHGKGHLTFWTRRKDGFFERTDIIKPVSRTATVALQCERKVNKVQNTMEIIVGIYCRLWLGDTAQAMKR